MSVELSQLLLREAEALQKFGTLGAARAQPMQGSTGQHHLYRIYPGKRPQVQPVFPLPPYFTLNNVVDVIQRLHIEDFLPLKISILLYCILKCQYIRIHYRTKQNQYNTRI